MIKNNEIADENTSFARHLEKLWDGKLSEPKRSETVECRVRQNTGRKLK